MYQHIRHLVHKYQSYDSTNMTHDGDKFKGTKIKLEDATHSVKLMKHIYYTSTNKYTIDNLMTCFDHSCTKGHLKTTQWLYYLINSIIVPTPSRSNNISGDVLLLFLGNSLKPNQWKYVFLWYCSRGYGHLSVIQWLYSVNDKTNTELCLQNAFMCCCHNGRIDVAKWLYSLGVIDIHADEDTSFDGSCYNGHLEIAQWLYSMDGKINIHIYNERTFQGSCFRGHLETAMWLYSLDGNIDIRTDNDEAFRKSCTNGHLDVVKWLYSLDNSIIDEINYDRYPVHIKEWIYSVRSG